MSKMDVAQLCNHLQYITYEKGRATQTRITPTPWAASTELVREHINGKECLLLGIQGGHWGFNKQEK